MLSCRIRTVIVVALAVAAFSFASPIANAQPAAPTKPEANSLALGAKGWLVKDLQRTLNARLDPSPKLVVDGEFGESTQQAVKRFQSAHDLKPTGILSPNTWKTLGALVTDPPTPSPETVNHRRLKKSSPDPLDGPPFVSCKAWAIADGASGKLLWGNNEDMPLSNASTTKIMTAYLVLKLAENDSSILEQEVTFSERADKTIGSSAKIRAGEKLIVRELLFGLMLPSGNDASVALAETFGGRFAVVEDADEGQSPAEVSLNQFVAQMNRTAEELGMKHTSFKNPHGLDAKEHHSSARDLLVLAHAAYQIPRFQDYVKTREHGCTLLGPGGYRRNIVWKNTNRLLRIEGYNGVKTGTTRNAGACLVSNGERDGRRLMIAVLGATSKDGRYVDSRNLYRWAWKELAAD